MEFEKLRLGGSFGAFCSARGVETERTVTATAFRNAEESPNKDTTWAVGTMPLLLSPEKTPCLRSHGLNLAPVIKPSEGNLSAPGLCCGGRSSEIYVTSKVNRELMQHICVCLFVKLGLYMEFSFFCSFFSQNVPKM